MARINEDIRFYLPSDPYYYQVDNLPLEDLLRNDKRLQAQLDNLMQGGEGSRVNRSGFEELRPYVETTNPGKVIVKAGNFIGRVERSIDPRLGDNSNPIQFDGLQEVGLPPTKPGYGTDVGWYNVSWDRGHRTGSETGIASTVARTALFQFLGGEITIDSFSTDDWDDTAVAPLGRLDLVGITTVNGAFDTTFLPGNPDTAVDGGDGLPKLAVVKGAGITQQRNNVREIVIGERYITLGQSGSNLGDVGRNLEGRIVPNPQFGTIPAPDDVVNVLFSRNDISDSLHALAKRNRDASFFLPLAYVYVPAGYIAGNPLGTTSLKDIRPFFRTAELTLAERQALVTSENPSIENPVVTISNQTTKFALDVAREPNKPNIQEQINQLNEDIESLESVVGNMTTVRIRSYGTRSTRKSDLFQLTEGSKYIALLDVRFATGRDRRNTHCGISRSSGNVRMVTTSFGSAGDDDDDAGGTRQIYFQPSSGWFAQGPDTWFYAFAGIDGSNPGVYFRGGPGSAILIELGPQ